MQRLNYVCVEFCRQGVVQLMVSHVLKQDRLTRIFKPVFILPDHRG